MAEGRRDYTCSECGKSCWGLCWIGQRPVCVPCFGDYADYAKAAERDRALSEREER